HGDDDLAGAIEKGFSSCDDITVVVTGWLESELGTDPGWPALKGWCDHDLRRDLKNVFLMLQLDDGARDPVSGRPKNGPFARILSYLLDHEYFIPEDAPRFAGMFAESTAENDRVALALLWKFIECKLGRAPGAETSKLPPFLQSTDSALQSFDRHFQTTRIFKA